MAGFRSWDTALSMGLSSYPVALFPQDELPGWAATPGTCRPSWLGKLMTKAVPSVAESMTVPEYLATTFRPDRDYIDGVIQERNLGEFDHARI